LIGERGEFLKLTTTVRAARDVLERDRALLAVSDPKRKLG
jgi:hypothetical protein